MRQILLEPTNERCSFILARLLGPLVARALRTWLWSRRVHAPIRVTLGDAPGNDALLAACPRFDTAVSSYDAVEALANRHASTIVASVFRADAKVEYQREVLRVRDGGHVTLDWPIRVPNEGGEETRKRGNDRHAGRDRRHRRQGWSWWD